MFVPPIYPEEYRNCKRYQIFDENYQRHHEVLIVPNSYFPTYGTNYGTDEKGHTHSLNLFGAHTKMEFIVSPLAIVHILDHHLQRIWSKIH